MESVRTGSDSDWVFCLKKNAGTVGTAGHLGQLGHWDSVPAKIGYLQIHGTL